MTHRLSVACISLLLFTAIAARSATAANRKWGNLPAPQFTSEREIRSASGYLQLEWRTVDVDGVEYELQSSHDPNFVDAQTLYRGPDTASFVSGLPNGRYFYRVRTIEPKSSKTGKWSKSVEVRVEHHSLKLAFTLFGLGLFVVLSTVWLIMSGPNEENPET